MNRTELRLSGSGGQGLITGGIILAEAALHDGLNVIQSQSYGPEARGGASKAEVIISDEAIDFPKVTDCDVLLSLTQLSCDKYLNDLKSGGILIIDESVKQPEREDIRIFRIPILETASSKLNKPMVANIIALGVIYQVTKLVSKESLEKAVLARVPKGTEELNRAALNEGFSLIG
ncbi:2-oxoacid:acceptor oxidoreductase family protein [Tissierella sp. Yu-01]|uniref:2-oxoacid:acceptor oxidoreductase family protein n=1 Tax=Tissierella sp. Yu-01 TaxID=3035694 RepID=UPI00240D2FA6|nr:2-oxoacid:acceptor oxidoreductase family protein [Tissierella sp. Yu-01]WFA09718.1 2-oxoacid:acceptor oxidoreductase family protein [Tissierella sp. Yu-01]